MDDFAFSADMFEMDFDSSGLPEQLRFDLGMGEIRLDFSDSVIPDDLSLSLDLTGDGMSNLESEWSLEDDGRITHREKIDFSGDGQFDVAVFDADGDLWPDFASIDFDGDGSHQDELTLPTSTTGLVDSLLDTGLDGDLDSWADIDAEYESLVSSPPEGFEELIDDWTDHWHAQEGSNSCAVCCQEFVIEQFTGQEITESDLCSLAEDMGIFDPNEGTYLPDFGRLFDLYGIEYSANYSWDAASLIESVNGGHGVIVGVDSYEVMGGDDWGEIFGIPGSGVDHAVQVIGFDEQANEFVLNDPGHPGGKAMRVDAGRFYDAWQDGGNFACVTQQSIV